jgi:hypothetical protein
MKKFQLTLKIIMLIWVTNINVSIAQVTERPLIWVKNSEKQSIIEEISNNPGKNYYYTVFKTRVDTEMNRYTADREGYLNELPFASNVINAQIPAFKTISNGQANAAQDRNKYRHYLQSGIDSGILYYLTGNEDYAKYSASLFYTFMKGMNQIPVLSSGFNAGWLYPEDHLRESRDIGAQIPVLYDFIATFIKDGGTAFDFAANSEVTIDRTEAEVVFKNYIFLAKNRGGIATNWPILESPSLVCNILALDSKSERDAEIPFYLNRRTSRQIPLSVVSKKYEDNDGNWPEPFTYFQYAGEFSTYLMAVLTKYDSSYNLVDKYSNIPLSLDTPNDFIYPNGNKPIHFGDSSRGFKKYTNGYEMAYYLALLTDNTILLDKFGDLINSSLEYDGYDGERFALSSRRSNQVKPYYDEPLKLLWFPETVDGESIEPKQNITNELSFAGITVQRNLETPNPALNGLMLFVGGAGFVHSYASGMNMELYGPKTVIGAAGGNTQNYTSTIHRNYYRLFAAHNTVIVNGASRGEGGIAGININRVKNESIEPKYKEAPVSLKNSFSTSSFIDDKGTKAEALQNRTMAIIRTSPTTGYYVDVFKSKSSLANEYHDYVYHNLSDNLQLQNNNTDITLTDDANRYKTVNTSGGFKNPGWHYFTNIKTSGPFTNDVKATFTATRLGGSISMGMHIPAEVGREYTKVNAPPTLDISSAYNNTPTPTVVIRKNGEAWKRPFAVVYEPYIGENASSVKNVTSIKRDANFAGMKVESTVNGKDMKQIILIKDSDNSIFNDIALEIKFTGRFAVLSMDENDELTSIYVGSGSYVNYKGWDVKSQNDEVTSFYVNINGANAEINTNSDLDYTSPTGVTVSSYTKINDNDGTLSVDDNELINLNGSFSFYQSKASNIWDLKTINLQIDNANLKIVDLSGKTVFSKKISSPLTEVDLSSVSNGFYIVVITNNNSIIGTKKIIKGR